MKVQTKIILLLVAVVATFLIGLWSLRVYDRRKFRQIAEERFQERSRSFDNFLAYHSQPLQTLTLDYTAWDQMAMAITRDDQTWFAENVNDATLDSFHTNGIWIYRADGSPAYRLNNLGSEELRELPVPREVFAEIFASAPLAHFFVTTPLGIMEIRAGTVHPSKDFERRSPPAGYFFAGRLWSKPVLEEMSLFTNNDVRLLNSTARPGENYNEEQTGLIAFSRTLRGWDGQPLAHLVVRNESPIVKELNRASERLLISLLLFFLVLLGLLTVSLMRWVSRPLRRTMTSLQRNDPAPVAEMAKASSEFGELARTIEKFFEQRDNLLREMEERRVTEAALRKSEGELRQSQKMEAIGRLAGGIAHDFNNLLTAIIGYADLIQARGAGDALVRQHAALIHKAGEQAAVLTRQLLAFSRKQLLQPRVIDLNQLVVDMEKLLRRVIGERFDLQTKPEAEIGRILADPSQLEQVILNLGVNARDAMPKGGRLTIRTATVHLDSTQARQISTALSAGDYVELSVADTGAGMSDKTKEKIFEPFFTTKGPGQGTGLGLATVYGIVRQSGGGIAVESALGKGSTFRIYFPLETRPIEERKPSAPAVEKMARSETVLVVEDEEIVRDLVCNVLEEQGYNVLRATDGVEGLRVAEECAAPIDLLVTDVIMPRMNGPELAERLARVRAGVKVLFVSGYSNNDISAHGVRDGEIELLHKPFTPETLARKVRDVIEDRARTGLMPAG